MRVLRDISITSTKDGPIYSGLYHFGLSNNTRRLLQKLHPKKSLAYRYGVTIILHLVYPTSRRSKVRCLEPLSERLGVELGPVAPLHVTDHPWQSAGGKYEKYHFYSEARLVLGSKVLRAMVGRAVTANLESNGRRQANLFTIHS